MKKLICILSAIFLASFSFAQISAVTTSSVNLREAPVSGDVLSVIPQGTSIELQSCQGDWCATTYEGETGYVYKKYVKANSPSEIKTTATATSPIHYYTNKAGNTVQSPTQYNQQPSGATAQCRDGSYSFSQNHRGTCSHHGGVSRWL